MRMNNKVMMTINPEPVHLEFDELVHDLAVLAYEYKNLNEILMMSKSEFKVWIRRRVAHYRAHGGPRWCLDCRVFRRDHRGHARLAGDRGIPSGGDGGTHCAGDSGGLLTAFG